MSASEVCEQVLQTLRESQPNFVLTESPFSVEIKIKKTFIKTNEQSSPSQLQKKSVRSCIPPHKNIKICADKSKSQNFRSTMSPSKSSFKCSTSNSMFTISNRGNSKNSPTDSYKIPPLFSFNKFSELISPNSPRNHFPSFKSNSSNIPINTSSNSSIETFSMDKAMPHVSPHPVLGNTCSKVAHSDIHSDPEENSEVTFEPNEGIVDKPKEDAEIVTNRKGADLEIENEQSSEFNHTAFENHNEVGEVSERNKNEKVEPKYMLKEQETVFLELVGKVISNARPGISYAIVRKNDLLINLVQDSIP